MPAYNTIAAVWGMNAMIVFNIFPKATLDPDKNTNGFFVFRMKRPNRRIINIENYYYYAVSAQSLVSFVVFVIIVFAKHFQQKGKKLVRTTKNRIKHPTRNYHKIVFFFVSFCLLKNAWRLNVSSSYTRAHYKHNTYRNINFIYIKIYTLQKQRREMYSIFFGISYFFARFY